MKTLTGAQDEMTMKKSHKKTLIIDLATKQGITAGYPCKLLGVSWQITIMTCNRKNSNKKDKKKINIRCPSIHFMFCEMYCLVEPLYILIASVGMKTIVHKHNKEPS